MLRSFILSLTLFLPFVCGGSVAQQHPRELTFGVAPYISPSNLVEQFSPLKEQLARMLGLRLALTSAPDFRSFADRTRAGEYDIVFTPPHMARLAQKRDGMRMVAQTGHKVAVVIIARRDGEVRSLDDLRGRSLATAFRTSMVHQVVDAALRQKQIIPGQDVMLLDTLSHSNVPETVARGDADAGATGAALWEAMPAERKKGLVEIYRSAAFPGFFLLAHPRLGESVIIKLRKAALAFADTPAGAVFFKSSKMVDFRAVDESVLRKLDPYTNVFEQGS